MRRTPVNLPHIIFTARFLAKRGWKRHRVHGKVRWINAARDLTEVSMEKALHRQRLLDYQTRVAERDLYP